MKRLLFPTDLTTALKVSVIYIIFSSIYYLFSVYIATSIFSDSQIIITIRVFQGWAFVVLSGLLIYLLIRRFQRISVDSEERFLLLADLTIEGIILHKHGVVLDVNDAFTELFGYKRTDIIGKNLIDIFICEEYKQVCNENTKFQITEPYEVMAKKKNGDEIWIQIIGKPFRFFGKNARVAAIRDITERKFALDALKENEKMLSVIVDSTPLILLLLNADLQVVKINQTGINISKKTEQQAKELLVGQLLNCVNSIKNIGGCGKEHNCSHCLLRSSILRTFETHESIYQIEAKINMGSKDNVFERNILIFTEYIDFEGKPHVLVCIDDITERVQMEDVLREKTFTLLKAQEMGRMGEFHYDIYRKTFKISSSLEQLLGFNHSLVTLEEFINSIHPDDKESLIDIFNAPVIQQNNFSINFRLIKPNGETQYFFAQAEIQRETNARAVKVFGIVLDITEQKKAEIELMIKNYELQAFEEELTATNDALRENLASLEIAKIKAEESDKLKSTFLSNMSHEIRTPMNAIMGFSDLLDREDMPYEKRKVFTKTIKERTKDLLNILNDILDISRIESHTLKIVETKGNINNHLIEIKDFFDIRNAEFFSKPITLSLFNELTPEQHFIKTDFDRIKQILISLIDNAFKFTAKGSIQFGCKLKDQSTIMFFVSDTGIGITKENQQLIFERFRQAEDTYLTREYEGAGLGLSICKGLVDLMNGSIWVESEVGKGSVFFFTIPFTPTNIIDTGQELSKNIKYDFNGRTILIVEDVTYNQVYLNEILKDTNATLIYTDNGAAAIEEFRLHPEIDIVLMDIRLPDINGLELTKGMISERKNIKIIAQTAYASNSDREKAIDAGCNDYISKPINRGLLLDIISKQLNK